MDKNSKIYVAGHNGMIGSAIVRQLNLHGYDNIVTRSHKELDLRNQLAVESFFQFEKPEFVFFAAARVGDLGTIQSDPAGFMYDNVILEMNVINSAWKNGVQKLEFISSSWIYPKVCPQPMKEEYLLTGAFEPTYEVYALAKIIGLKFCEYLNKVKGVHYITLTPCNLYGINDKYGVESAHVMPGMIRRFHEAKVNNLQEVICWGDGSPHRQFLYADDFADACIYFMNNYDGYELVNIASERDVTIKELAEIVAKIVGFDGMIKWDISKPSGKQNTLLDVNKAKTLGWKNTTSLEDGIRLAYEDFKTRIISDSL